MTPARVALPAWRAFQARPSRRHRTTYSRRGLRGATRTFSVKRAPTVRTVTDESHPAIRVLATFSSPEAGATDTRSMRLARARGRSAIAPGYADAASSRAVAPCRIGRRWIQILASPKAGRRAPAATTQPASVTPLSCSHPVMIPMICSLFWSSIIMCELPWMSRSVLALAHRSEARAEAGACRSRSSQRTGNSRISTEGPGLLRTARTRIR